MPPLPASSRTTWTPEERDDCADGSQAIALETHGGLPVLARKHYSQHSGKFSAECKYSKDLPMPLEVEDSSNMRLLFEAMIRESTLEEESDVSPVTLENDIDNEPAPQGNFHYTNDIWHGEGVPPPDIQNLIGCDCDGKCNPKSKDCASACQNRLVQHGRRVQIVIKKTASKGWGVFAGRKQIPSKTFIGIFSGELITESEAQNRATLYDQVGAAYLFDLDFHHLVEGDGQRQMPQYTMDASRAGNFTRFLNHSCDPNATVHPCYVDESNLQKPLLAFFSARVIEAGEEICISYSEGAGHESETDSQGGSNQTQVMNEIHHPCLERKRRQNSR